MFPQPFVDNLKPSLLQSNQGERLRKPGANRHDEAMKRCSYCGAQYPDDATICALDQTHLESSDPALALARAELEAPEEIPPRPDSVKLAIGSLAASIVVSWLQTFAENHFTREVLYFQLFQSVIGLFFMSMLFERKRWVRWIIATFALIWFATLVFHFRFVIEATIVQRLLLGVQLIIWTTLPIMLFMPEANEWFRKPKRNNPA